MPRHGLMFGDKHWKQLTKNSKRVVKKMDDIVARSMLEQAIELKNKLEGEYDAQIEFDKDYLLESEQVEIYNENSLSYHYSTTDLADESGGFNTLRGTDTNVITYVSYNKSKKQFTVGAAGADIIYIEYGAGDIGDDTDKGDEAEARQAVTGINLKPFNSGQRIQEEDGWKYWIYHSSVHFGIPVGGVAYRTFKEWCKDAPTKIVSKNASKQTIGGYLTDAYRGKDIR